MTEVQILLDIQRTLGSLEASQTSVNNKLEDIHEQVKYTNGRVNILRNDVDNLLRSEGIKKESSSKAVTLSMSKEQVAIIGGAIITIIAYIADKLSII